jgi:hypothetical protein
VAHCICIAMVVRVWVLFRNNVARVSSDYFNDFNDKWVINVDVCLGFCSIKLNFSSKCSVWLTGCWLSSLMSIWMMYLSIFRNISVIGGL